MKVKLIAPAKINLNLMVGERFQYGYHDIDTIMQAVSLYDIIEIEEQTEPGIKISVSGPFAQGVPTDENNICVKAAKIYSGDRIHIHIEKNIPHAAGLGGGSSDAAAVIIGINQLAMFAGAKLKGLNEQDIYKMMELMAGSEELNSLAGVLQLVCCNIGADVPFFVRGGMRRCTGIGMDLADTEFDWGVDSPRIVIAKGKEGVSTKAAYEALDAKKIRINKSSGYFNSFNEVVSNDEIEDIKKTFREYGAHAVSLSGSGTAVYAVFGGDDYKTIQRLKYKLREKGYFCETVEPVAHGGKVTWAQI
jgi:4-diphosphocytidyl-2-C-methyl-D-erythritol kinase